MINTSPGFANHNCGAESATDVCPIKTFVSRFFGVENRETAFYINRSKRDAEFKKAATDRATAAAIEAVKVNPSISC